MSDMKAHTLGQRITGLRGTYSLERETLAERSGVSVDLIAKVEDEGLIPDLATLLKMAQAFGVRLGTLLDDYEEQGPVVTRAHSASASAAALSASRKGIVFKSLAATKGGRHMEPFLVDIRPDAVREEAASEGEAFIHVVSGNLKFEYGNTVETLKPGDSVYYDAIVPHRVSCADDSPARILTVIYTPL
jgi:quercetin dioxygenase-like cupin family protein